MSPTLQSLRPHRRHPRRRLCRPSRPSHRVSLPVRRRSPRHSLIAPAGSRVAYASCGRMLATARHSAMTRARTALAARATTRRTALAKTAGRAPSPPLTPRATASSELIVPTVGRASASAASSTAPLERQSASFARPRRGWMGASSRRPSTIASEKASTTSHTLLSRPLRRRRPCCHRLRHQSRLLSKAAMRDWSAVSASCWCPPALQRCGM